MEMWYVWATQFSLVFGIVAFVLHILLIWESQSISAILQGRLDAGGDDRKPDSMIAVLINSVIRREAFRLFFQGAFVARGLILIIGSYPQGEVLVDILISTTLVLSVQFGDVAISLMDWWFRRNHFIATLSAGATSTRALRLNADKQGDYKKDKEAI